MFINRIAKYPRELISFTNSIKTTVNLEAFMKLDFKYQLGWYIDYLNANNLTVVVNRVSYRIYYDKTKNVKRKKFVDLPMIKIWEETIVDSFEYLEKPF